MDCIKIPVICAEAILALTVPERGRLLGSLLRYIQGSEEGAEEPRGNEYSLYLVVRAQIDRDSDISRRRAEAGRRGGEAKASKSSKAKQTLAKDSTPPSLLSSPPTPPVSIFPPPKEKPPKGGKKKVPQGEEDFCVFWAAYPNHCSGRANALKSWQKVNPDGSHTAEILSAVEEQKQWPQWQKEGGAYVPMATTWLNQRRWDAEGGGQAQQDSAPSAVHRAYHTETIDGEEVVVYDN